MGNKTIYISNEKAWVNFTKQSEKQKKSNSERIMKFIEEEVEYGK
jgi:hypothetical protein